jgi:hypothetical protein
MATTTPMTTTTQGGGASPTRGSGDSTPWRRRSGNALVHLPGDTTRITATPGRRCPSVWRSRRRWRPIHRRMGPLWRNWVSKLLSTRLAGSWTCYMRRRLLLAAATCALTASLGRGRWPRNRPGPSPYRYTRPSPRFRGPASPLSR